MNFYFSITAKNCVKGKFSTGHNESHRSLQTTSALSRVLLSRFMKKEKLKNSSKCNFTSELSTKLFVFQDIFHSNRVFRQHKHIIFISVYRTLSIIWHPLRVPQSFHLHSRHILLWVNKKEIVKGSSRLIEFTSRCLSLCLGSI